jgi:hypothetical protein
VQHEQPRAIDFDARLRDAFLSDVVVAQRLAECDPLLRALTHQRQCPFGHPNLPHTVMNAARAQAALRNLEPASFAKKQILAWHTHVFE